MPQADATPTASAQSPALPSTYEAAQQELESLVARLESGQLPLEELLGGYRRAADLLAFCRQRLQAVESQIQTLDARLMQAGEQP
jgi:exodeoxyribonuclease VII small subunit